MHIRLRSRISVRHTTRESILKPRPARIPETRDNTPGSFCTRQFRTCLQMANGFDFSVTHGIVSYCYALFKRLEARRRGVIEDIRDGLLRSSLSWQIHHWQGWWPHTVRSFVVQSRSGIINGWWGSGGIIEYPRCRGEGPCMNDRARSRISSQS